MEHFEIHIDEGNVKLEGRTLDLMRGLAIAAANIIRNNTKPGVSTGSVATVEVDVDMLEQVLKRMQDEKGGEAE